VDQWAPLTYQTIVESMNMILPLCNANAEFG
jgi:hypothetical protein